MSETKITRLIYWGYDKSIVITRDYKKKREYKNLTFSTRERIADLSYNDNYDIRVQFLHSLPVLFIAPAFS